MTYLEGMTLSEITPAAEHFEDPIWYNQAGYDLLDVRKIFRMEAGPEHRALLEGIVKKYPKYGPKMYERAAELGQADVMELLLELRGLNIGHLVQNLGHTSRIGPLNSGVACSGLLRLPRPA
jgi:hypothetical protein